MSLLNTHLSRFEISLNSFKLACCIGWCVIWIFKLWYRKYLYPSNWNIASAIGVCLEPALIALAIISVTLHLKLNDDLKND